MGVLGLSGERHARKCGRIHTQKHPSTHTFGDFLPFVQCHLLVHVCAYARVCVSAANRTFGKTEDRRELRGVRRFFFCFFFLRARGGSVEDFQFAVMRPSAVPFGNGRAKNHIGRRRRDCICIFAHIARQRRRRSRFKLCPYCVHN